MRHFDRERFCRGKILPMLLGLVALYLSACGDKEGLSVHSAQKKNELLVNPSEILWGARSYRIIQTLETADLVADDDHVRFSAQPSDKRHLSPCPAPILFAYDLNLDRITDVAFYSCGWLSIYPGGSSQPLSAIQPIEAKWKEHHWLHIDKKEFPAIDRLNAFIMKLDPEG